MSRSDYQLSKSIADRDYPFYALLMAAMRKADSRNAIGLRSAFPEVWRELQARYDAPDGELPEDLLPDKAAAMAVPCGACPHPRGAHWDPGIGDTACSGLPVCSCSKYVAP